MSHGGDIYRNKVNIDFSVNLNPLAPEDTARKWVEYLGDTDAVISKARVDYDKGEYQ